MLRAPPTQATHPTIESGLARFIELFATLKGRVLLNSVLFSSSRRVKNHSKQATGKLVVDNCPLSAPLLYASVCTAHGTSSRDLTSNNSTQGPIYTFLQASLCIARASPIEASPNKGSLASL